LGCNPTVAVVMFPRVFGDADEFAADRGAGGGPTSRASARSSMRSTDAIEALHRQLRKTIKT
jgi:hypothetical protein